MARQAKKVSRKAPFQRAIEASLEALIASGEKITKLAVIDNARFDDGRPVGKATLYCRNEKTRELVHKELHKKIDNAADRQTKDARQRQLTKIETVSALRKVIKELKAENSRLRDQLVEQEARVHEGASASVGLKNQLTTLEEEKYVLAKVFDKVIECAIPDFGRVALVFEKKYRDDKHKMNRLSEKINAYLKEVRKYKLVSFDSDRRSVKE